jgi:hypothetical protein
MASTNYRNKFFRFVQGGPRTVANVDSSAANQWYGDTTCVSRNTFVAAPMVAATSRISLTPHWFGTPSLAVAPQLFVSSVQAGSGFYISTVASVGFAAANQASFGVWWEVSNP